MTKRIRWTEANSGISEDQIDEERGIIRNVKVIGKKSRNGRTYRETALNDAIPLYEGSRIFIDHIRPDSKGNYPERKLVDRWGELQNVRRAEDGDGLRGDIHFLKHHRATPALLEAARRFPKTFGLSHDADGDEETVNGIREVTKIYRVNSVDVVNDPATTKGLFESKSPTMKFSVIAANKSKFAKILEDMISADPTMGAMDVSVDDGSGVDGASPEDHVEAAFTAAIMSVCSDATLDVAGKMAKIKILLAAQQTATDALGGSDLAEQSEDDAMSSQESAHVEVGKLREENRKLKLEADDAKTLSDATKLLQESKREITDVRLKALVAVPASDRKALVESWPVTSGKPRPTASKSIFQETEAAGEYPKTLEEVRRRLI